MKRFLAGAGSALLLVAAGFFIWTSMAQEDGLVPEAPEQAEQSPATSGPPRRPPSADERSKEQRRFDRADRDKDGRISLAEILYPRQRPFQRLDADRDGKLSFEEWAIRTREKFAGADANRDGNLSRPEYAATAPRPRPPARQKSCNC